MSGDRQTNIRSSRRTFLQLCSATLAGVAVDIPRLTHRHSRHTSQVGSGLAIARPLSPTPSCPDTATTPEQLEGPFYLCDSPERSSLLESGISGRRMILMGQVLSVNCIPIANALVDFWQADERGQYDEDGYRLRGHQFTDTGGHYRLETIVPGIYPGRTRHLHVKIQLPERPFFSTQLYFPADPLNDRDRFFQPELVMSMDDSQPAEPNTAQLASFTFVVEI